MVKKSELERQIARQREIIRKQEAHISNLDRLIVDLNAASGARYQSHDARKGLETR